MNSQRTVPESLQLSVENVGGIRSTEVDLSPGVTVLEGRNATNRTSLLQALMAVCGSENVSVKGDAERATVRATVGGETYERTLERSNGSVVASGEPLVEDQEVAELFAFLLESNEARRAVARGDDLRELIMRPVDTTAIQAEISQLEARKRQIDDRLETIEERKRDLPDLESERTRLTEKIEDKREDLADLQSEIDAVESDVDEEREERREVESKLDELNGLRSKIEDLRYDEETEREIIEELEAERDDLQAELEDMEAIEESDVRSIESELADLREERQRLDAKIGELDTVIQFNEEMLDGTPSEVREALADREEPSSDGAVTDRLLEDDDTVTCWTCGSTVAPDTIESTVDHLRDFRAQTSEEKDDVDREIDELESKRSDLERRRERRGTVERRLDEIDAEIEDAESTVESLQERREELSAEIESVEADVERLREESRSELLDLHERANEIEFEIERLEQKRSSVEDDVEEIESLVDEKDDLVEDRERVQSELEDLRTRIDRIQENAVEMFNEHMATVIDRLEYRNLDRVWIERVEREVTDGRSNSTTPAFDLHVIRNSEDGVAYEDTVDHLSESEREVVGLVFGLAGYLVHDVHETCPFVLLDSLEALDSGRISRLVEYLDDYSDYLVVALLPEDAQALDSEYERIEEI